MDDARVERRLSAILAADVVGYSRLMEVDETGTLARLKVLRRELIDPQSPVDIPVFDHQIDALATPKVSLGLIQRAEPGGRIDAAET